jgi:hypothetical protein
VIVLVQAFEPLSTVKLFGNSPQLRPRTAVAAIIVESR